MQRFNSKISFWLFAPILCFLIVMLILMAANHLWGEVIILLLVNAFILSLLFRTYYQIEGNTLKIVCGFIIYKRIDINRIRKIEKTNSLFSSPALSVRDRIEIFYNTYDSVIISPERQAEFTQSLKLINKDISTNL